MIYDKARELAQELKQSEEYRVYQAARDAAMQNETTCALIKELHQLQMRAQAAMMSGGKDNDVMERLQKVGEILQFNPEASAYLTAEFRLNRMIGDVYKILAEAIDVDLSMLEG